jgi:hypothetical protein
MTNKTIFLIYKTPPLSIALLSMVSVTRGHLLSTNIKWKIPEINNSQVLNCAPFWVA